MTPQELKNSILQLAIQGKLVEQLVEEGTAAELLEKILAAKNAKGAKKNLTRSRGARGENKTSATSASPREKIPDDEKPFDIPESWEWVRLGDLGSLKSGYAFKSAEYTKDGIQVVRISDLGDDSIGLKDAVFYPPQKELTPYLVADGSFLICMTGSIGKMAWVKDGVSRYLNQRVGMFVPDVLCSSAYLWFFLHTSYVIDGWIRSKTSTNGNIKNSDITGLLAPLPPLAEQKRIVAKIEELLPLIDRYEKAWSKLEDFNKCFPVDMHKSLLQMAIQGKLVEQRPEEGTGEELYRQIQAEKQRLIKSGKIKKEKPLPAITEDEIPFDIPDSWKWVRLGQLGNTNIGLTYGPKDVCDEGVVVLRSSNIQNGKMDYADIVKVSCSIPESKMCHVGDILICARNGSKRLVGKAALIDRDGMSFGAFMAIFRSSCNAYILHVINSAYFRNSLLGDTGTTTINQITQDMLKNALIPLPPLAEQKRIVAKLEELLPLCERLK